MEDKNKKPTIKKINLYYEMPKKDIEKFKNQAFGIEKYVEKMLEEVEKDVPNAEENKKNELVLNMRKEVFDEIFSNTVYALTKQITQDQYLKEVENYLNIYTNYLYNYKDDDNDITGNESKDDSGDISYIR